VEQLDDRVRAFGWAWDNHAQRLRADLELEIEDLERWPTLSPGERKRWQIAAALEARPDLLLLDEPTNHLDARARAMLTRALTRFGGIGLVVSHDRELLDALTQRTLWLDGGVVKVFDHAYSSARELREAELETQAQRAELARRTLDRTRRQLADRRRANADAVRSKRSKTRMKSRLDHDGRSSGAKARATKAEAALARDVKAMMTRVSRAESVASQTRPVTRLGRSLHWDHERPQRNPLIALQIDTVEVGGRVLFANVAITLRPDHRVHLRGDNGAGKSTLLALLRDAAGWPRDRLLYLPQELDEPGVAQLFDTLRTTPADERGRWLQLAAALGLDPDVALTTPSPSPGEARKLLLARGLAQQVWCLLLDEPTNHLDLPSVERLEAALADYPGAMVLVSHDAQFAARCTDRAWQLEAGGLDTAV
jgi:ATPase subunit of ABC transporter with duplicated ATPase domains